MTEHEQEGEETSSSLDTYRVTRRTFFQRVFGVVAAGAATLWPGQRALAANITGDTLERSEGVRSFRRRLANRTFRRRNTTHPRNNEERAYPFIASFSKGLPHDSFGEVSKSTYKKLLTALETGKFKPLSSAGIGIARLANPQAAIAYTLQGPDSHQLKIPQAPTISGTRAGAEMGELYWQALCRDVSFTDYESDTLISEAVADLNGSFTNFRGAKVGGQVTGASCFRGTLAGDEKGPYLSQFLLKTIPMGSFNIEQKQQTVVSGFDHHTTLEDWLFIQNGQQFKQAETFDGTERYIRNGRDLTEYVREDLVYQAYFNAAAILLDPDLPGYDAGNPFFKQGHSGVFTTFGPGHLLSLLGEVSAIALKAAWYQKWYVHRRLRPEEFGGRVHHHMVGNKSYPINEELLSCDALQETFDTFGTYLLPQAYLDGCPTHPSYPAGHSVVAGACVTILKAFFDEEFPVENPVQPDAAGTALENYNGSDAGSLTVGGELNKLASNIAIGRNWAGIHYRTDATAGFELGESVALGLLREQRKLYNEKHSFTVTRFDGTSVRVNGGGLNPV